MVGTENGHLLCQLRWITERSRRRRRRGEMSGLWGESGQKRRGNCVGTEWGRARKRKEEKISRW